MVEGEALRTSLERKKNVISLLLTVRRLTGRIASSERSAATGVRGARTDQIGNGSGNRRRQRDKSRRTRHENTEDEEDRKESHSELRVAILEMPG